MQAIINKTNSESGLFEDLAKVLTISEDVLSLISSEFCFQHQILPIEQTGNVLKVAYVNPIYKVRAERLLSSQYPNLTFEFMQSTEQFLLVHIHECYTGITSNNT